VLRQYAKGLSRIDPRLGGEIDIELERVKWYLWHGNVYEALFWLDDIEMFIYNFEESYANFAKLEKALDDFHVYIGSSSDGWSLSYILERRFFAMNRSHKC
jgi:hypothetical protein